MYTVYEHIVALYKTMYVLFFGKDTGGLTAEWLASHPHHFVPLPSLGPTQSRRRPRLLMWPWCPAPRKAPGALGAKRLLTHAAGLVAGPLVVLLARDDSLANQLEGRLALESERVPVEKAAASPPSIGRDARVPTASLRNL